jgi:ABC-type amino acid transport substrate-binding protein
MLKPPGVIRLSVLIAGWLIFGWMGGCASIPEQASLPVAEENLLRVGVSTNAPPLIFRQGGKIVGLEADLAGELAKSLGKSVQFVELTWKDQIPALLENRIDIIMSGMSITPLREVRIAFSSPYFTSGQMGLIRRKDEALFKTGFFALSKKSAIGAIKNTTGEYFVETQYGDVKKLSFSTSQEAVRALIDEKIDIFIHDAPIILYLASENETKGLTPLFALLTKEYLAWGIRKGDTELLTAANTFLKTINDTGKLKKMIQHWIPFTD